jgi:hypothetical protein
MALRPIDQQTGTLEIVLPAFGNELPALHRSQVREKISHCAGRAGGERFAAKHAECRLGGGGLATAPGGIRPIVHGMTPRLFELIVPQVSGPRQRQSPQPPRRSGPVFSVSSDPLPGIGMLGIACFEPSLEIIGQTAIHVQLKCLRAHAL